MFGETFNDTALILSPFSDWRSLFIYLYEKAQKEKFLLAIDEFPYLINANSAITSIFQNTITGGVPFYLADLDLGKTAAENILDRIARKGKMLYEEGELLLKEELRDPSTYFSIRENRAGY
jgi:AAA+ ATPase superfamily predicted ATPase